MTFVDPDMFERKLIAGCVQDHNHYQRAKRGQYCPEDFTNEAFRKVWKVIDEVGSFGDYNQEILIAFLSSSPLSPEDKRNISNHIEILSKEDIVGFDLSLEKISHEKKKVSSVKHVREYIQNVRDGRDLDNSLNKLKQKIEIITTSEIIQTPDDYYSQVRMRDHQRNHAYVKNASSGIKMIGELEGLSRYFDPFISSETMTSIEGKTGGGKSVILINFLRCALMPGNGLNCLYVYLENRALEAEGRLDALLLEKPYKKELKKTPLKPEEIFFMENMSKQGWGQLRAQRLPYKKANVGYIRYLLTDLADKGVNIHAVFVDSPDHLSPTHRQENFWLNKSYVYEELKMLCEDYKVAVFGTRQQNFKEEISAYSGSGGQEIPRLLDNIISIDFDPKDHLTTSRGLIVPKCRDGIIDYDVLMYRITDSLKLAPEGSLDPAMIMEEDKKAVLNLGRPRKVTF